MQGPLGFRFQHVKKLGTEDELEPGKGPMLWSSESAFYKKALKLIIHGNTALWTLGSSCVIWFLEATFVARWPTPCSYSCEPDFRTPASWKTLCNQNENSLRLAKITDRGYLVMWKISLTGVYFNTSLKAQFCRLLSIAQPPLISPETSGPNPQLHKSVKLLLSQIYAWLLQKKNHIKAGDGLNFQVCIFYVCSSTNAIWY